MSRSESLVLLNLLLLKMVQVWEPELAPVPGLAIQVDHVELVRSEYSLIAVRHA